MCVYCIYIYIHTVGESDAILMLTKCQLYTISATCAVMCSRTYSIVNIVVATHLNAIYILPSPHVTVNVTPARSSGLANKCLGFAEEVPASWLAQDLCVHKWAHLLHHGQALRRFVEDRTQQQINRHARAVLSVSAMQHHLEALRQILFAPPHDI